MRAEDDGPKERKQHDLVSPSTPRLKPFGRHLPILPILDRLRARAAAAARRFVFP